MNRRRFFVGTAAAALAPFALSIVGQGGRTAQDGVEWFTNVPVMTQDGRTLRFYDDVMKGKILLINFFFTECDDVCPLATENLVRVQELLGDRVGKEIRMVSISLQPEHDTPEVMAAYAKDAWRRSWLAVPDRPEGRHRTAAPPARLLGYRSGRRCGPRAASRHRAHRQRADASLGHEPVAAEPDGACPGGAPGDSEIRLSSDHCAQPDENRGEDAPLLARPRRGMVLPACPTNSASVTAAGGRQGSPCWR